MFGRPKQVRASGPLRLACVFGDLHGWGTQRQGLQLARRLNPAKYQAEIWTMSGGDGLSPLAKEWGLPVVWLSRSRGTGPRGILGLARRLASQPPHILFLLNVVPNIWGRILGHLARVPLIVGTCRGGAPEMQHERWLWPLAHHLICNNRALKENLTSTRGIPGQHITVIHNGLDTDYFRPPAVRPYGPPVLICVARLHPDKDHLTLFRAFQRVREKFPEARLWLVGDGGLQGVLQDWVEKNFPGKAVEFFGTQQDIRPYLHQASLLVLNSIREAMPNAILEAMACGLPVVATRVGGVPEVVIEGETGVLVPPRDLEVLGEAICRMLADPGRLLALGQAGLRRAREEFSFEAMVRRHEEVFDRLLARLEKTVVRQT